MINLKMDTRRYKRKATAKDKEREQNSKPTRPFSDYRNDPEYLRPRGACHCDKCVEERYWAGDSR